MQLVARAGDDVMRAPPYVGTTTACVAADKGDGLYRLCPGGDPARCHDAYCDTTTSGGP